MNRKYIIGGIAICLGLRYLSSYFLNRSKGHKIVTITPRVLAKSEIMSMLRDLRHSLIEVYTKIASTASGIKEQANNTISDNELRQILLTQTPVKAEIELVKARIYRIYEVPYMFFKFACEKQFANDIEVQNLIAKMDQDFENSLKGIPPRALTNAPDFLTEELVIEIVQEMNDASKLCVYEEIEDIWARGVTVDSKFHEGLGQYSARRQDAYYKIFEKYGLTEFDKPATALIQDAVQKYSQTNPKFFNKLAQDQESKNYAIQMIKEGTFPREEIFAIIDRLRGRPLIETSKNFEKSVKSNF